MNNIHCQICGECVGEMRGTNLIVFENHANDHAAQIDLKDLLAFPEGVEAVRRAIIGMDAGCLVK